MSDPPWKCVLLKKGNWKIRREGECNASLWHVHHSERKAEYSTLMEGTMRCHSCKAKPPAALRGLVMIANWNR